VDRTNSESGKSASVPFGDLTPVLRGLVEQSARPLRAIETTFAADSTGFATTTYSRWFDHKYGEEKRCRRWTKVHGMVGTLTNVSVLVHSIRELGIEPKFWLPQTVST
jgi:hypothetical protein